MRVLLAATLLLFPATLLADDSVRSRSLELPQAIVSGLEPQSFDLIDFRADEAARLVPPVREVTPHTIFGIKQHLGFAGGYDNGVVHGSLGFYITVAEWGRWNFGVPSPALGFGRYRVYDAKRKEGVSKEESTIFVSLASVHFRAGHIRTLGVNWYINLEQVFDMRRNMAGSQFGISFSRK
jgi:hypothetical protein